jgi:hypothetical protein
VREGEGNMLEVGCCWMATIPFCDLACAGKRSFALVVMFFCECEILPLGDVTRSDLVVSVADTEQDRIRSNSINCK